MAGMGYAFGWQVAGSLIWIGVGSATLAPSLLPYYTRRYYQRYDPVSNAPVDVDDHTLSLVVNVLHKLKFPEEKEKKLDVFVSYTTDPQYHGSFSQRFHSLLGVPLNFAWRNAKDLEQNKDLVFKRNFPWDHPSAEAIKQAMVLDDEEKEFVIARQLGYLDTKNVWGRLIQRCICITLGFAMGHTLNYRFGHYKETSRFRRPNVKIGTMFGLSAIAWYFVAKWVDDSYTCYLDSCADKYAATIDRDMAAAGQRYYDKIIRSNIAMREILPGAERKFTVYGNEQQGMIRTKSIPLVARRDYMRDMS